MRLTPPLKIPSKMTMPRITHMLREYIVPTMMRIGSTGKIRLTSVMRWMKRVDPLAPPDADGRDDHRGGSRAYGRQKAKGQGDRRAPKESDGDVAAAVVGAGQAVELAVDDQLGVDVVASPQRGAPRSTSWYSPLSGLGSAAVAGSAKRPISGGKLLKRRRRRESW